MKLRKLLILVVLLTAFLLVPAASAQSVPILQYTVKQGDTLGKIAAGFEVTVQSIVDLNKLASPDAIQAGQTLEIPAGVVVIAELPETATTAP